MFCSIIVGERHLCGRIGSAATKRLGKTLASGGDKQARVEENSGASAGLFMAAQLWTLSAAQSSNGRNRWPTTRKKNNGPTQPVRAVDFGPQQYSDTYRDSQLNCTVFDVCAGLVFSPVFSVLVVVSSSVVTQAQ